MPLNKADMRKLVAKPLHYCWINYPVVRIATVTFRASSNIIILHALLSLGPPALLRNTAAGIPAKFNRSQITITNV